MKLTDREIILAYRNGIQKDKTIEDVVRGILCDKGVTLTSYDPLINRVFRNHVKGVKKRIKRLRQQGLRIPELAEEIQ